MRRAKCGEPGDCTGLGEKGAVVGTGGENGAAPILGEKGAAAEADNVLEGGTPAEADNVLEAPKVDRTGELYKDGDDGTPPSPNGLTVDNRSGKSGGKNGFANGFKVGGAANIGTPGCAGGAVNVGAGGNPVAGAIELPQAGLDSKVGAGTVVEVDGADEAPTVGAEAPKAKPPKGFAEAPNAKLPENGYRVGKGELDPAGSEDVAGAVDEVEVGTVAALVMGVGVSGGVTLGTHFVVGGELFSRSNLGAGGLSYRERCLSLMMNCCTALRTSSSVIEEGVESP